MVARTVAIDADLRNAPAFQVVILGAGLDGRAWRMRELGTSLVFEVNHPDSQQQKLQWVASLTREAREVRFVPVDFGRGDLAHALAAAGHDPHLPTAWLWEGVVMYLDRNEIETTLRIVEDRSAPGLSRMLKAGQLAGSARQIDAVQVLTERRFDVGVCARVGPGSETGKRDSAYARHLFHIGRAAKAGRRH
jgi:methyltransferase (TIGR00027 family)